MHKGTAPPWLIPSGPVNPKRSETPFDDPFPCLPVNLHRCFVVNQYSNQFTDKPPDDQSHPSILHFGLNAKQKRLIPTTCISACCTRHYTCAVLAALASTMQMRISALGLIMYLTLPSLAVPMCVTSSPRCHSDTGCNITGGPLTDVEAFIPLMIRFSSSPAPIASTLLTT